MKQKMSTTHSGKVSDGTKRKNVEESMQNKSSTNVQQLVESEQGSRDDAVPPKKHCRIKCGGHTVHAPMLVQDPRLPSLGEYSHMITTPEKNPVQEKRQYHLTKNKESEITSETQDKEEGEIDDTTSDLQLGSEDDINDYEIGNESSENESNESGAQSQLDESEEGSDTGMDVHDNSEDEVCQENIPPVSQDMNENENEETFLGDFDLSLRDIVQIPEEMLISPDEIIGEEVLVQQQNITSDDEREKQRIKADKHINKLEQLIKGRIEKSKETEKKETEMFIGDVSQPLANVENRNVIRVQPIASYDEIFALAKEDTQQQAVENVVNIKQEPSVTETDEDVIFMKHDYADIHSQIKSEPSELVTPIQAPSAKRTILLKNILKALKQPVGECNVETSKLSSTIVNTKLKDPVGNTKIPSSVKSTHGKIPRIFIPKKCSTPVRPAKEVVDISESNKLRINIVDITGQEKLKTKSETVGVHRPVPTTNVIHTKQVSQNRKPTETVPLQVKVRGNIDKQTTIQGNIQNLTIQHVTTPSVVTKSHPAIPSTAPSELTVHMPAVTVKTQSEMAMEYRARKRMKEKEVVSVEQQVQKEKIRPPVPVSEQLDQYYYCDKCDKRFRSKNYFRMHMTRLCKALENPQVLMCKTCGKMFKHEKNYKSHLGVHDGVKRFTCSRCGQKFVHNSELLKHRTYCRGTS